MYKIDLSKLLGQGTTSKVYAASKYSPRNSLQYAAKVTYKSQPDLIKRVKHEQKILEKLKHTNVIALIDYKKTEEHIILFLKYYPMNLTQYLIKKPHISEQEALQLLKCLLKGLKFIHKKRIVHRDIKPDNLLINSLENPELVISDFADCLHLPEGSISQKADFVGSEYYSAPEVLLKAKGVYSMYSDIWSAGVIFYQLLYGEECWKLKAKGDLLKQIVDFPQRELKNYEVSEFSEKILREMLDYEPEKRGTAKDLIKIIEQWESMKNLADKNKEKWIDYFNISISLEEMLNLMCQCLEEAKELEKFNYDSEILVLLQFFSTKFLKKSKGNNSQTVKKKIKALSELINCFTNPNEKLDQILLEIRKDKESDEFSDKIIGFYNEFLGKLKDFLKSRVRNDLQREKTLANVNKNTLVLMIELEKIFNFENLIKSSQKIKIYSQYIPKESSIFELFQK